MAPWVIDSEVYSLAHNISHIKSDGYLIHSHPFYEMYYFVEGDVDYLLSGVEYKLKPNTMVVIVPNEFHGIRVNSTQTYDRWTLHFDPDLLSVERRGLLLSALPKSIVSTENAEGEAETGGIPRFLEEADKLGLRAAFECFDTLPELPEEVQRQIIPIYMEALMARLYTVMARAPRTEEEKSKRRSSNIARQVTEYINMHFTEKLTLDMLSEKFYISKSHLNLSFRKAMGTSVIDYLIYKRVSYAQQLLINGLFAAQAATLAGFSDYTSFYRAYVKHFNHSPNQDYRKQPQGRHIFRMFMCEEPLIHGKPDELRSISNIWDRLPATEISAESASMLKDK